MDLRVRRRASSDEPPLKISLRTFKENWYICWMLRNSCVCAMCAHVSIVIGFVCTNAAAASDLIIHNNIMYIFFLIDIFCRLFERCHLTRLCGQWGRDSWIADRMWDFAAKSDGKTHSTSWNLIAFWRLSGCAIAVIGLIYRFASSEISLATNYTEIHIIVCYFSFPFTSHFLRLILIYVALSPVAILIGPQNRN